MQDDSLEGAGGVNFLRDIIHFVNQDNWANIAEIDVGKAGTTTQSTSVANDCDYLVIKDGDGLVNDLDIPRMVDSKDGGDEGLAVFDFSIFVCQPG